MSIRIGKSRLATVSAITSAVALLALAGCSGSNGDSDSAGDGGSSRGIADEPQAAAPEAGEDFASGGDSGDGASRGGDDLVSPISLQPAALIRTAVIELQSEDVGDVITKIHGLVLTSGGRITSEDTATNEDGEEVRSRIELQVPVAKFDAAYDEIPSYATLVDQKQSTEDVTGQLADVNSRVKSAQESIDQLRLLFSRATRLGDVITLERELSQRQADLEALQAQQRSLDAQTTMSTIMVSIGTPDVVAQVKKDEDQAGFVSGIKKGWDGMVTFVVGTAHAVGLVLPLGSLLIVIGLAVWVLVRRFIPRRESPVQPQPSE
jgi:hypothetical protein